MRHLTTAAVALHGPVDVALTAAFFGLETNPVVVALGLGPWLLVKTTAVVALGATVVALELDEADHRRAVDGASAVLLALGLALVGGNIPVVFVS